MQNEVSAFARLILNEVRYHFDFRGVVRGRRQNELCSSPPLIPCESLMYDTENEGPRTPHLMLVVLTQIVAPYYRTNQAKSWNNARNKDM